MIKDLPVERKIINIGRSRAITIPPSWFELIEKRFGKGFSHVELEIDNVITITPIIDVACCFCGKPLNLFEAKSSVSGRPAHQHCLLKSMQVEAKV